MSKQEIIWICNKCTFEGYEDSLYCPACSETRPEKRREYIDKNRLKQIERQDWWD